MSTKLQEIRQLFEQNKIDAYFIPHNDSHNSEYLADCDERLSYISNFTGSAGLGLITQQEAFLWTDSRYFIQAQKQLKQDWTMKKQGIDETWQQYALNNLENKRLGFDPLLISADTFVSKNEELQQKNIEFIGIEQNLVDQVWNQKPQRPQTEIFIHDIQFVGQTVQQKVEQVAQQIIKFNCKYYLITALDEIAWLLNLRGSDISCNPVFFSYLLLKLDEQNNVQSNFYIDQIKINQQVQDYLKQNNINVSSYNQIFQDLQTVDQNILLTKNQINSRIYQQIKQNLQIYKQSPVENLKAVKNEREQQGMRECHIRDGAALVAYLAWLKHELLINNRTDISEYDGSLQALKFRSMMKDNMGLSFETISSIGPNAAICHYSPDKKNSSLLDKNLIYLVDSGGQYLDGTTDITRTVHYSTPKEEEKLAYTMVLLGNLDLERLSWPLQKNVSGSDIDAIARRRLWNKGLDFGHGTGHGVGYFLNVHEGPIGINSKRGVETLKEGMVLSNEPGYYEEGKFGIRIENLCIIVKSQFKNYLTFENISMCPYDRNLIDKQYLTNDEIQYINDYHTKVYNLVSPILIEQNLEIALNYLKEYTQPL